MANEYLEHVTTEGDRWDLLSYRYYANPYGYEPLCVANPSYARLPILPSGIRLRVPIVEAEVAVIEELPPWKK